MMTTRYLEALEIGMKQAEMDEASGVNAQRRAAEAKKAEFFPSGEPFFLEELDGVVRPAIQMDVETHRLLRAVAIKRGDASSIGAVVGELVERHRAELKREAGSLFQRELAKKR